MVQTRSCAARLRGVSSLHLVRNIGYWRMSFNKSCVLLVLRQGQERKTDRCLIALFSLGFTNSRFMVRGHHFLLNSTEDMVYGPMNTDIQYPNPQPFNNY